MLCIIVLHQLCKWVGNSHWLFNLWITVTLKEDWYDLFFAWYIVHAVQHASLQIYGIFWRQSCFKFIWHSIEMFRAEYIWKIFWKKTFMTIISLEIGIKMFLFENKEYYNSMWKKKKVHILLHYVEKVCMCWGGAKYVCAPCKVNRHFKKKFLN